MSTVGRAGGTAVPFNRGRAAHRDGAPPTVDTGLTPFREAAMSELERLEAQIPALRRYAWALLRNRTDADDLVQDCLERAIDRLASRDTASDMRPWLFAIMHNLSVSRWRRFRFRSRFMADDPGADAVVEASQTSHAELRTVFEKLAQLPDEQRQVLLLVGVEGFAYQEVASILNVPIGTVMSRLSRARDRLREMMEGRQRPMLRSVK